MPNKVKLKIGETSNMIADELRRMLLKIREKESKSLKNKKQNKK